MSQIPKNAALMAVGRTVVNFQRLENNLKLLARFGALEGTVPKVLRDVQRRIERAADFTLGQAIQTWLTTAGPSMPSASDRAQDLFDITVAHSISLEIDSATRDAHAAALGSLLETRNKLIHGQLAHFQWNSPQECERLIAELEGVNAAIATQIEFSGSAAKCLSELTSDFVEELEAVVIDLGLSAKVETVVADTHAVSSKGRKDD